MSEEQAGVGASPRIKIRIESLSDMVFGLALSIGSLILIGNSVGNGQQLAVNILEFGFGFVIIVLTWVGYSRIMAMLPQEVSFALMANLVLLFLVALEPYLLYVLFQSGSNSGMADAGSVAYALDVGGMFLVQAGLAHTVVKEYTSGASRGRTMHSEMLRRFRSVTKVNMIVGVLFVVSALPVFWIDTPIGYLRFVLWYASFVQFAFLWGRRRPTGNGKTDD